MHPYGFLKVGAYMPCHRISQWSGLPDCDCLELSVHSAAAVSHNRCKARWLRRTQHRDASLLTPTSTDATKTTYLFIY